MSDQDQTQGRQELVSAAASADWVQVVMNGGPPCFHVEDGKFCLRAARWDGHHCNPPMHRFVGLSDLLGGVIAREDTRSLTTRRACPECGKVVTYRRDGRLFRGHRCKTGWRISAKAEGR